MRAELSESQLSAYLDGELSASERAAVDELLRDSVEQRQMLAELQQLREAFQTLPQHRLGSDFSNRVLQAALAAEKAAVGQEHEQTANVSTVQPAASSSAPASQPATTSMLRRLSYAGGLAAALAACWLVMVQFSDPDEVIPEPNSIAVAVDPKTPEAPAGPNFASLHQALPGKDEALIIRIRVPEGTRPDQALDAALAQSGIVQRLPSETTLAGPVGAAYRTVVRTQQGVPKPGTPRTGNSPSDAMFIEAPLGLVEDALATLANQQNGRLDLQAEMTVAVTTFKQGSSGAEGEGEDGSGARSAADQQAPFAQRLNSRMFQLPKEPLAAPTVATDDQSTGSDSKQVDPNQKVRVLILVETIKPE